MVYSRLTIWIRNETFSDCSMYEIVPIADISSGTLVGITVCPSIVSVPVFDVKGTIFSKQNLQFRVQCRFQFFSWIHINSLKIKKLQRP